MQKFKFYIQFFLVGIWFLIASFIGLFVVAFCWKNPSIDAFFAHLLSKPALWILGLRVCVENKERLYQNQPCVYVANHQSNLDILTYGSLFPTNAVTIGKKEMLKIPIFGWFFVGAGNIIIDRKDRKDSLAGIEKARDLIVDNGVSVWIFPEGTRNRGSRTLLPFKKGAFHMAIATQVPIVITAHQHLHTYFDAKEKKIHRSKITIRVLEPIPTKGLRVSDVDSLMETVRSRLQASMDEMG